MCAPRPGWGSRSSAATLSATSTSARQFRILCCMRSFAVRVGQQAHVGPQLAPVAARGRPEMGPVTGLRDPLETRPGAGGRRPGLDAPARRRKVSLALPRSSPPRFIFFFTAWPAPSAAMQQRHQPVAEMPPGGKRRRHTRTLTAASPSARRPPPSRVPGRQVPVAHMGHMRTETSDRLPVERAPSPSRPPDDG